jgi:MFS family permease
LKSRDISQSSTLAIAGYIFYNLIYAAFSYPAGILSDKFGKKKIFVSGLLVFSLVYFGFGISGNFILMWFLFALYGIYASATEGIAKAWISDLIPNEYRSSAIGLLTMLSSFAVMLGSILTGFLWDQFGSAVPFYISSAVSLVICVILMKSK